MRYPFEADSWTQDLFLGLLERRSLAADSYIRMLPSYSLDFVAMTGVMSERMGLEKLHCEPDVIRGSFDAVHRNIIQPTLPEERNWMIDTFLAAVDAGLSGQEAGLDSEAKGPGER